MSAELGGIPAEANALPADARLHQSAWRRTLREGFTVGRTRVGLGIVIFVVFIAVVGPFIAPHGPNEFAGLPFAKPGNGALLGTDFLGQDVLSRVLHGGFSVLWMSVAATALGVIIGVAIGMVAGYRGGFLDEVIMWGSDVVMAFPQIVLAIVFVSMLGANPWLIVGVVALSHIPRVARLARSLTQGVVRSEYIEAAEVIGMPTSRLAVREILPNLVTPLTVEATIRLAWSVAIVAALSFVGFGIQPPVADWGLMINENRTGLVIQPWAVLAPMMMVALFAVGVGLMGEGFARTIAGVDRKSV